MKRYIRCAMTEEAAIKQGRKYAKAIRTLFDREEIVYAHVQENGSWEEEIRVVAEVYGDWRNNNQRALELIEDEIRPDSVSGRELDRYESRRAKRFEGTDSAVMRIYCTWDV